MVHACPCYNTSQKKNDAFVGNLPVNIMNFAAWMFFVACHSYAKLQAARKRDEQDAVYGWFFG